LPAELAEVIGRDKFAAHIHAAGVSAAELVEDYARLGEIVVPASFPVPVSRDPDDDLVLATALAAEASLIVSGDRDLLVLGTFRDIRILDAADALAALGR
jgi:putative PIN family toxin of toxin-antitoxin system